LEPPNLDSEVAAEHWPPAAGPRAETPVVPPRRGRPVIPPPRGRRRRRADEAARSDAERSAVDGRAGGAARAAALDDCGAP
jgi:hypothetical protein